MSTPQQWQKLKNNYLKQVEDVLASVDYAKKADVLRNVSDHLDRKYADLPVDKVNWEGFQQILIEMGPPQDYAELLSEETNAGLKKRLYFTEVLTIIFLAGLIGIISYVIFNRVYQTPPKPPKTNFNELLDKEVIVDIDHSPNNTKLSVQYAVIAVCQSAGIPYQWDKSAELADPERREYIEPLHIKNVPTKTVLENILTPVGLSYVIDSNGLYLCRPESPAVLSNCGKNDSNNQAVSTAVQEPEFALDEQVLGKWITVDFVRQIEDFDPAKRKWWDEFYLKEMIFYEGQTVACTYKITGTKYFWTKGKVNPSSNHPAAYYLREIDGKAYLFFEWISGDVTIRGQEPWYYVLKKEKENEEQFSESAPEKPVQIDETPINFIISFKSATPLDIRTAKELLDLFNQNQPSGVRTHHYRTTIQDNELIGAICVDSQKDADAVAEMLKQNESLELLEIKPAVKEDFEKHCLQKQISLPGESEKNETVTIKAPIANNKPSVLGRWIVVDCVKRIEAFTPTVQTYKKRLMLKDLHFIPPQTLYWNFDNGVVKRTTFSEESLETINEQQARYFIHEVNNKEYLFIEWITPDVIKKGSKPDYYVLRRQKETNSFNTQSSKEPASNNKPVDLKPINLVGRWVSVDFVQNIMDFKPQQRQWAGDLYLKDLTFNNDGTTSGPWTWTKDWLWHPGDRTKSYLTVQNIQGTNYLFMEWMSGDVTIRGQKPHFYVLKKVSSQTAVFNPKCRITFGTTYANYVRSVLGRPDRTDMNGRKLCYDRYGFDLIFSTTGPLNEAHLNSGYNGKLDTGISLNSKKQDVFNTYGQPFRRTYASDLHRKNVNRVLFQKDNMSRIYYENYGLIFWFRDNDIIQIVPFRGTLWLE